MKRTKRLMLATLSGALLGPIACDDKAEEREDLREERRELREEVREDDEIFQEGQRGVFEEEDENIGADPYEP